MALSFGTGACYSHALRTGQLTEQDWNNVMIAQGALAEAPIYIDDTPGIKITNLKLDTYLLFLFYLLLWNTFFMILYSGVNSFSYL